MSVVAAEGLNLVNGCEPPTFTNLSLVSSGVLLVPTTATQNNKQNS